MPLQEHAHFTLQTYPWQSWTGSRDLLQWCWPLLSTAPSLLLTRIERFLHFWKPTLNHDVYNKRLLRSLSILSYWISKVPAWFLSSFCFFIACIFVKDFCRILSMGWASLTWNQNAFKHKTCQMLSWHLLWSKIQHLTSCNGSCQNTSILKTL